MQMKLILFPLMERQPGIMMRWKPKLFTWLVGEVPVNSLKGYYGHTLGAAGILESIVTIHSMKENIILPTFGFTTPGTEMPVNIVKELKQAKLNKCLKTASGFGGCNAAL